MFSLEKMRKLQKQFKSKVQSQNIMEPEFTSLAEIMRNRHKSFDMRKRAHSIENGIAFGTQNPGRSYHDKENGEPQFPSKNENKNKKRFISKNRVQKTPRRTRLETKV